MFRDICGKWFAKLLILIFLISTLAHAENSPISETGALADLIKQQELYSKYFMGGIRSADGNVWDDFLAQPRGVAEGQRGSKGSVVSLASHPSCIATAWLSIESLMRQEIQPARIILNLYGSEFPTKELPWTLQQQVNRGLEINWVEDDANIDLPLTRSDILHPSRLINYFASRQLDDLVIIPYNVSLSHSLDLF